MGFDSHYVISVCELREYQKANNNIFFENNRLLLFNGIYMNISKQNNNIMSM